MKEVNSTPLVSVILPVYNAKDYIEDSIKSILYQTYRNFELIIIDDGSSDGSLELINKFSDERLKIIRHDDNQGLIKSLNEGIKLSSGELIARMDADDISLAGRLEKQVKFLNSNPEIGVCSTWYRVLAKKTYIKKDETDPHKLKSLLLYYCPLAHPTVMLRKNLVINESDFYSLDYPHAEDYELWIRLSEITKIANIPEVLFQYRPHENQISKKYKYIQENSIIKAQIKLLNKLNISPNEEELRLNKNIFFREFPEDMGFVKETETWLTKIIKANETHNYFNEIALAKVTFDTWFLICTHLAGKGIRTKEIFFNSKLFHKKFFNKLNHLKFTIKNIIYS